MNLYKDKNLIKCEGRKYYVTYNLSDGTIESNYPDGKQYLKTAVRDNNTPLGKLMKLILRACDEKVDPFIETIFLTAPKLFKALLSYSQWNKCLNDYIKLAHKKWKYVLEIEKDTNISEYNIEQLQTLLIAKESNLNETERKFVKTFQNIPFIKRFAGQLEMYYNYLDFHYTSGIVKFYNEEEIQPFLKNKNLLQTIKELEINKEFVMAKRLQEKMNAVLQNYKQLETETENADGFSFQLLKSVDDFKKEAEEMKNCLYRAEYFKKVADGKSLIVVAINDKVRIDFEIDLTKGHEGKIIQAFYAKDHEICKEDKEYLVAHVSKYFKK